MRKNDLERDIMEFATDSICSARKLGVNSTKLGISLLKENQMILLNFLESFQERTDLMSQIFTSKELVNLVVNYTILGKFQFLQSYINKNFLVFFQYSLLFLFNVIC